MEWRLRLRLLIIQVETSNNKVGTKPSMHCRYFKFLLTSLTNDEQILTIYLRSIICFVWRTASTSAAHDVTGFVTFDTVREIVPVDRRRQSLLYVNAAQARQCFDRTHLCYSIFLIYLFERFALSDGLKAYQFY